MQNTHRKKYLVDIFYKLYNSIYLLIKNINIYFAVLYILINAITIYKIAMKSVWLFIYDTSTQQADIFDCFN